MKKFIIFLLFFSFLVSCRKSLEPSGIDPRLYTWTVDTLFYPTSVQTMMQEIWASSPKDVYAVGHCSSPDGNLYHFDGISWQNINLNVTGGGPISGSYRTNNVFGFNSNDVYVVGEKANTGIDPQSMIVHYNGNKWEEIEVPPKETLLSVWGSAPDDIWAGGNSGTLFHYNESQWKVDSLPHPGYPDYDVSLNINDINGYSADSVFFSTLSVLPLGELLDHFFLYSKNKFTLLDSSGKHTYETWLSPQGIFYKATNYGIFVKTKNHWEAFYSGHKVLAMTGSDDSNIWAITKKYYDWYVLHYNGTDWYTFENIPIGNTVLQDIFLIDDEVFICGYTNSDWPNKTIVFHGK